MQYTDNEAALIGGLISNYFFQPSVDAKLRESYRAAKDTMNTILNGAKLPKIEALKKSRRELAGQKKALYAEYREAQRQMREAVAIKANIDHLLGITDERENKAQER